MSSYRVHTLQEHRLLSLNDYGCLAPNKTSRSTINIYQVPFKYGNIHFIITIAVLSTSSMLATVVSARNAVTDSVLEPIF